MWEYFDHTADIGIKAEGNDLKEIFIEMASAMFHYMADVEEFPDDQQIQIECEAETTEDLLVEFLNRLLYLSSVNRIMFSRFTIQEISETHLSGIAIGGKIKNSLSHILKNEVKAATYYQLEIRSDDGRITARCVLDV